MSAAERMHVPAPEEVMAYLDGEATTLSRGEMEAHLAACETCRSIADGLRAVAGEARTWQVGSAPASLEAPTVPPPASWSGALARVPRYRLALAGFGMAAAALIFGVTTFKSSPRLRVRAAEAVARASDPIPLARSAGRGGAGGVIAGVPESAESPARSATLRSRGIQAAPGQGQVAEGPGQGVNPPANVPRGPMVIRTATLRIVVKEFGNVRGVVEALVTQVGGFVDHLTVNSDIATARSISGSLRVPSDRMNGVLDRLRQLGQVVEDTQGSEDVTDQIVDLDARLANARATEERLTDLLKNRTGRLSDVLSVERELARVRLDIERLDAEKTNTTRRVAYATIEIQISEERKAGLETGPLPLTTRIRVAAADGAAAALETVVSALLFLLSAGPTLLVWGLAAAALWFAARRKLPLTTRDSR